MHAALLFPACLCGRGGKRVKELAWRVGLRQGALGSLGYVKSACTLRKFDDAHVSGPADAEVAQAASEAYLLFNARTSSGPVRPAQVAKGQRAETGAGSVLLF